MVFPFVLHVFIHQFGVHHIGLVNRKHYLRLKGSIEQVNDHRTKQHHHQKEFPVFTEKTQHCTSGLYACKFKVLFPNLLLIHKTLLKNVRLKA
jgi:hypothetical protein